MTRRIFSYIKYIALISLIAVSLVVVFEQYNDILNIEENEYKAVNESLERASERMDVYFKLLRSRVALVSYREIDSIREIFDGPDEEEVAETFISRVREQLPGAFAVTIADTNGAPLITDFQGLIGDVCLHSIQLFVRDKGEYPIQVHPHPVGTHFDVMMHFDDPRDGHQGVFFVSFGFDEIVEILHSSQLPGHRLYLVLEAERNLIEVTPKGSRSILGDNIYLAEQELERVMGSVNIQGTMWQLLDLPVKDMLSKKLSAAIAKLAGYIGLILLMVLTIVISLRQEFRSKRELKDINELLEKQVRQRTKNLEAANRRSQTIVEFASDAIISVDHEQKIRLFNESAERMFGYTSEEIIGQPLSILIPEKYRKKHVQHVIGFENDSEHKRPMRARAEIECLRKDGVVFPAEAGICRIEENGKALFTAFVHDLSERKEKERFMMSMAMSDDLTGLANRRYFDDQLKRAVANARRLDNKIGIMMIDIDHFKSVNDSHGHRVGDKLLQRIAAEFKACLRETDIIGRVGGDEFAAVITGLNDSAELDGIARKMIAGVSSIREIDDIVLNSSISIGMSIFPDHGDSIEKLVTSADKALYFAKKKGRNTFYLYTGDVLMQNA